MILENIEKLLTYAKVHLHLKDEDTIFYRNFLLSEFNQTAPFEGEIDVEEIKKMDTPDYFVNFFSKYLSNQGLSEKEINTKLTKIFGLLIPSPSRTIEIFNSLDSKEATKFLYDLGIKSNYVQKTKIDQNIIIPGEINNHEIVITINLSKPEKSNKDIKAALAASNNSNYPLCPICIENEGCIGSPKTAPRVNLRIIPFKFGDNTWYLQYSPYGYYSEHCILILKDHLKMEVKKEYVSALFDFVDRFPHYFIGSNSDLPIVGGSILSHEHFQGGNYTLPLMKAKDRYTFKGTNKNITYSILDWPSTVICLKGTNKNEIIDEIDHIYKTWLSFSYEEADIINFTNERHNTMTSIVRKIDDTYVAYLIPRNNRCDEKHPGGIFHVREELQIIKNEGIGLIEAMGLFILPARLKRQLSVVEEISKNPSIREKIYKNSPDLEAFDNIISDLINKKYSSINDLLIHAGESILEDINVFKNKEFGEVAFTNFLNKCGYER